MKSTRKRFVELFIGFLIIQIIALTIIGVYVYRGSEKNLHENTRLRVLAALREFDRLMDAVHLSQDQVQRYCALSIGSNWNRASAGAFLTLLIHKTPCIHALWLIDSNGSTLALSEKKETGLTDDTREKFFSKIDPAQKALGREQGFVVLEGRPWFVITQPIRLAGEQDHLVLAVVVPATFLDSIHSFLKIGTDDSLALLRLDGVILARSPLLPGIVGRKTRSERIRAFLSGHQQSGTMEAEKTNRGPRIVSLSRVGPLPLAMVGSVATRDLWAFSLDSLTWVIGPSVLWVVFMTLIFLRAVRSLKLSDTRRQMAEKDLRESEERIRTIFFAARDVAFVITDFAGKKSRIKEFSPGAEKMFGYPREEIIEREALRLFQMDPDRKIRNLFDGLEKSDQGLTLEVVCVRKSGDLFPAMVAVYPLFDTQGKKTAVLGVALDVSERKAAEEKVRKSEENLRQIVQNMPVMLSALNEHRRVLVWNRECERVTGFSAGEVLGHPEGFRLVSPDPKRYDDVVEEIAKRGEFCNWELDLTSKNGSSKTILWSNIARSFPIPGWYTWAVGVDITDLKKAEADKSALKSQLLHAQKMEAVGTLAGGIAHDFNNLLHAISGYTQILLLSKTSGHPDFRHLTKIQHTSDRAAGLVQQLLTFSRKADGRRRPMDLNLEIREAARILERTIPKMVRIQLHLQPDLAWINADPAQMEQIFLNLGSNAADAMPGDGLLHIQTRGILPIDGHPLAGSAGSEKSYVMVTVSDTGHGMAPEIRDHIFEPFFTTKEVGKGTGLGLASVYGIVQSHEGVVECFSRPGHGTSFSFYFPALENSSRSRTENVFSPGPASALETILVVDDDPEEREWAADILDHYGYRTLGASNGGMALDLMTRSLRKVDLVLLDLEMPGMNGEKCGEALLEVDPAMKIVLAHGVPLNGKGTDLLKFGAVSLVPKPYKVGALLDRVRSALDA